jgi:hypothetical protein
MPSSCRSRRVGLKRREDRQHAEERPASSGRGVDGLLKHPQVGARFLDLMGDVG